MIKKHSGFGWRFPRALSLSRLRFTLIELLVVLAVIAILTTLLLPALGKARELSKSSRCTGNLKQCALAMFSYAGDNADWTLCMRALNNEWGGGVYNQTFWGYQMAQLEYLPQISDNSPVMRCPAFKSGGLKFTYTYGMRGNMDAATISVYFKIGSRLADSRGTQYSDSLSSMPIFFDSVNDFGSGNINIYASPNREQFCLAHNLRGNTSFFDGHAATVKTQCGYFTKGCDINTSIAIVNPLPPGL
jgi:prepilin-type N-terminal cleavage/methylation domain-containing protein/prepilin-type processing-associated H-X9-DG protein